MRHIGRTAAVLCAAALCAAGLSGAAALAAPEEGKEAAQAEGTPGEAAPVSFSYDSAASMLADMELAAENGSYRLYYQPSTMAVAVEEKKAGRVYLSNPYNAEADPYCSGNIENNMESQAVLTYLDEDNTVQTLWSSADCVELGQFSYLETGMGVRFSLSVGRDMEARLLPKALTAERFHQFVDKLEDRPQRRMRIFYLEYSLETATSEEEKEQLLRDYPAIQEGPVYILGELTDKEMGEAEEYLREAGYTEEDLAQDNGALGLSGETESFPNFKLQIEYTLEEDGLTVSIPNESIVYERDRYTLLSVRLLEYFGADKPQEGGRGYLFIPDGSGAVIEINGQDDARRRVLTGVVYGQDAGRVPQEGHREGEPYSLPVFGLVRNDASALFAILESGDEMSEISAQLGDPNSEYYCVYNTFLYTQTETLTLNTAEASTGSARQVIVADKNTYRKDYRIRYHFLTDEEACLGGMAACYRDYLTACGMRQGEGIDTRLGLHTLGSALYTEEFLGLEYSAEAAFTRYEDNAAMLDYFRGQGVEGFGLLADGWQKRGLDTGAPGKIRISSALGGRRGLESLIGLDGDAVHVDFQTELLFVANDRAFDGFMPAFDAAKRLDKDYAGLETYSPSLSRYVDRQIALSPLKYEKSWRACLDSMKETGMQGLSLGSVGSRLNSDFQDGGSNRGQSRDVVEKLLKAYAGEARLSFDGTNAYVLPYADSLREISLSHSGYEGESYAVPFLSMAVGGHIRLYAPALNLTDGREEQVLDCILAGVSPSAVLAMGNTERLKKTAFTRYYAVSFDSQKEEILQDYQTIYAALEDVQGSYMTGFQKLAENLFCADYANGCRVYVNYGSEDARADGRTIPARGSLTAAASE